MPEEQQPAVGRIVHYVSHGTPGGACTSQCRAAIITTTDAAPSDVSSQYAGLAILNPEGAVFNPYVVQDAAASCGTWHWPEIV